MKLIFATGNAHKVTEIKAIAPAGFEIVSLKDIGFTGDLPETQDTIEGNSLQKAETLGKMYNTACFSEDTGLMIDALNGEPGVYSARYAGPDCSFADNVAKVLANMKGLENRTARFKTVITYYNGGQFVQFEGVTEGFILTEPKGEGGFGYDPIFVPLGSTKSYAEMTLEEKGTFSHRKKSFDLFANHLKSIAVI
jgi:XTP/dITP diphosphohydrolase